VKRDFQHILKKQKFENKLLSKGRTNKCIWHEVTKMKYAHFRDDQQNRKNFIVRTFFSANIIVVVIWRMLL
jgi:hypothetical protein